MKTWWPYVRLASAALGLAAVIAQLSLTVALAADDPTPWGSHLPTVWWNFFSFFTIDSNIIAAVAFVIAGIWAIRHRRDDDREPTWLAILLVCASTYMIVTGIVYNTLLRGIELPQGITVPWSNEVLHVVFPLILLLDVLFAPRRRALPWSTVFVSAIFPLVWAAYTMIRANLVVAPATGQEWWYPYPFLNPHVVPGGYLGVSAYIVGIAIAIISVACFVVWVGRRRAASVSAVV
ncbi:Pr6Pr family membrane protein [Microbacterium hydrocarbonoxydans]|uniref:Pr6Pr family membrane protein n=1 Tax=Microbacterium hydrocarbonoxydans TaxID=273678 RepID=UPI00204041BC|nr:Pr6Pr family membrane protein [Microbacterium hydrocarbonoxydans]MCM3778516.1 Pr6Pr family membrane protein [Microbacterium hydrocarbonoxydans]